ncbi:HPr(Ser) kinase/phosphatase [Gottschalkiaceae bacterium SANA]|nr:HPr(Ser) kinase/phosphatase [Gottschalkiaceae bacterium SANA]
MAEIKIEELIEELGLEVIHKAADPTIFLMEADINRPGLQLAGYFDFYSSHRLQVIGFVEWSYLEELPDDLREERLHRMLKEDIPALIICRDQEINPYILKYAKQYDRNVFRSRLATSRFITKTVNYLDRLLAPQLTLHGVLVDVDGVGILIQGESGVGKSETALELIKRGHRLVADDAVKIKLIDGNLLGNAPELIRYFLEVRGIGIINVKELYGVGAIRNSKTIELVMKLELWDDNKAYDRIGMDDHFTSILGKEVPELTLPVRPGRNLAMIIETAAKNQRQKSMGYNAAQELNNRILKQTTGGK